VPPLAEFLNDPQEGEFEQNEDSLPSLLPLFLLSLSLSLFLLPLSLSLSLSLSSLFLLSLLSLFFSLSSLSFCPSLLPFSDAAIPFGFSLVFIHSPSMRQKVWKTGRLRAGLKKQMMRGGCNDDLGEGDESSQNCGNSSEREGELSISERLREQMLQREAEDDARFEQGRQAALALGLAAGPHGADGPCLCHQLAACPMEPRCSECNGPVDFYVDRRAYCLTTSTHAPFRLSAAQVRYVENRWPCLGGWMDWFGGSEDGEEEEVARETQNEADDESVPIWAIDKEEEEEEADRERMVVESPPPFAPDGWYRPGAVSDELPWVDLTSES